MSYEHIIISPCILNNVHIQYGINMTYIYIVYSAIVVSDITYYKIFIKLIMCTYMHVLGC